MSDITDVKGYLDAIASVESRGQKEPYQTKGVVISNPKSMYYGDQALGKYQVMGKNLDGTVDDWGKKYLGRTITKEEFLANPQLQDALITAKGTEDFKKYGNWKDAASVWFTGQPLSTGANSKDQLGTSGQSYADQVAQHMASGGTPESANSLSGILGMIGGTASKIVDDIAKTPKAEAQPVQRSSGVDVPESTPVPSGFPKSLAILLKPNADPLEVQKAITENAQDPITPAIKQISVLPRNSSSKDYINHLNKQKLDSKTLQALEKAGAKVDYKTGRIVKVGTSEKTLRQGVQKISGTLPKLAQQKSTV